MGSSQPKSSKLHTAPEAQILLQPKIKPQQIGLKVLFQPNEIEDIELDVVAVHGIAAHPEYTWTHKEKKVSWLSEPTMLPAALPKARIMTFGYLSYWFGDDAVRQSVNGIASKMLQALCHERAECGFRPIIFIGHCMGGLVIQQAYKIATLHKEDYPNISDSVTGVVFLGTPHHGVSNSSGLQTQGKIYQTIVQAKVQIQDNVLHSIAQDNDVLVSIVHDFTRVVSSQQESAPKLFCFYEEKTSKIGKIAGVLDMAPEFVVGESSGTLSGHMKEPLPLDHFTMNTFEDAEDDNYKSVCRQIVNMSKGSRAIIEGRLGEKAPRSKPETSKNMLEWSAGGVDGRSGNIIEQKMSMAPPSTSRYHLPSLPAPIAREKYFAPRGGILELIEAKFKKTVNVVLRGDSGNGKTHIAVEYANKFHREHPGSNVHWVNAGSTAELELSYKRIAKTLHLSRKGMTNGDVVEMVHDTLKQYEGGRWLMVLDGLNDKMKLKVAASSYSGKSLLDIVPNVPFARVLITTRSEPLASRIVNHKDEYVIKVSALMEADAALLLLGKKTVAEAEGKSAFSMAKELGCSAGTLTMAQLYRQTTKLSWTLFKETMRSADVSAKKGHSAMPIWQLLYRIIEEKHADASRLLLVIGLLDVQSIPDVFFERNELNEQIPCLVDYGMVEPSADKRVLTVTAIIRQCVQVWLDNKKKRDIFEEKALSIFCAKFNEREYDTNEVLLPCALAILKFTATSTESKSYLATLLFRIAQYFTHIKENGPALEHLKRCLSLRKEDPERNEELIKETGQAIKLVKDNLVASGEENKALIKTETAAGRISQAQEELQELQQSMGQDHPKTIRKASDFATIQLQHGGSSSSKEIIALYQRALDWSKNKSGKKSIDTARRQYNLALAHDQRGEYDDAALLYSSAFKIAEQHLGPGSPELLRILGNLACMYCAQGRLEDAQQVFGVVLEEQIKAFGVDHPETLVTRQNVAMMLGDLGQVDEACAELEKVLIAQARLLGLDNPATFRTACSVAVSYRMKGLYRNAEEMLRVTLGIQKNILGETHRDTVMTKLMLNELLQEMGKPKI